MQLNKNDLNDKLILHRVSAIRATTAHLDLMAHQVRQEWMETEEKLELQVNLDFLEYPFQVQLPEILTAECVLQDLKDLLGHLDSLAQLVIQVQQVILVHLVSQDLPGPWDQ